MAPFVLAPIVVVDDDEEDLLFFEYLYSEDSRDKAENENSKPENNTILDNVLELSNETSKIFQFQSLSYVIKI